MTDAPRVVLLTTLAILGWGVPLWVMGLDLAHAFILSAVVVAVVGLHKAPAVNLMESWPGDGEARSDTGARREVARLSWSMQGYESRVQRQSVRRLYDIAVFRLGESGLDLDDPRDYLACQAALGERAYRVVSEPDERPLYADFVVAVAAVETLGSTSAGADGSGLGRAM